MVKITKSTLAEQDLIDIWVYIARDNIQAAEKQLDRFEERFNKIAELPSMGAVVQGLEDKWLDRDIRLFPVGNYIIFYAILDDDLVEVIRVINSAQDYTKGL